MQTVTPHAGVRIEIYYGVRKQWQGQVTPHAGVRIEIRSRFPHRPALQSPPMRGSELKYEPRADLSLYGVTPHAGVRIEIDLLLRCSENIPVTHHAGVRIEVSLMT